MNYIDVGCLITNIPLDKCIDIFYIGNLCIVNENPSKITHGYFSNLPSIITKVFCHS